MEVVKLLILMPSSSGWIIRSWLIPAPRSGASRLSTWTLSQSTEMSVSNSSESTHFTSQAMVGLHLRLNNHSRAHSMKMTISESTTKGSWTWLPMVRWELLRWTIRQLHVVRFLPIYRINSWVTVGHWTFRASLSIESDSKRRSAPTKDSNESSSAILKEG